MYVYIAIIAAFWKWHMDSRAFLQQVTGWNLYYQGTKRKAVCTLEGAWYVNAWGSVHWGGSVDWGCKLLKFIIKMDQSETNKNHIFNMSLKFTNHKCLTAK